MRLLIVCIFSVLLIPALAQSQEVKDSLFLHHLSSIKNYEEILTFIDYKKRAEPLDTLTSNLYSTISAFHLNNDSLMHQIKLNPYSTLTEKKVKAYFWLKNHSPEQVALIEGLPTNILDGTCLLNNIKKEFYKTNKPRQSFNLERYNELEAGYFNVYAKKPFNAAVLSTVIPGLGKVYAGQPKQGAASFLMCSILGFQFYETAQKNGVNHWRSIAYGTLFSAFYVGNIWGSAIAINVNKREIEDETYHQVMLHIRLSID